MAVRPPRTTRPQSGVKSAGRVNVASAVAGRMTVVLAVGAAVIVVPDAFTLVQLAALARSADEVGVPPVQVDSYGMVDLSCTRMVFASSIVAA